jgi:predicted kinase
MELIVFSGLPGAGKTTFYRERFLATHVRVGLDLLKTREREDILLHACFAAKQPVVVDNTNPLAAQRMRYASLAEAAGFRTALYFFDVTTRLAVGRNATPGGRRSNGCRMWRSSGRRRRCSGRRARKVLTRSSA